MSSWVEFSNWIVESSFSTRLELSSSTSQLNSTLFQKNFNSTRLDAISLSRLQNELQNRLQNYLHKLSIEFSCLLCSEIASNLTLLLDDDSFFKLVIWKLRLRVKLKLDFKEKVILRCFFLTANNDDLDLSLNLESETNFIKFLWFTIFCNNWSSFFNLFLSVKCDVTWSKWADAENWAFKSEVVVDLAVLSNVDNISSSKFENLNCENVIKRSTLIESSFFSSDIVN